MLKDLNRLKNLKCKNKMQKLCTKYKNLNKLQKYVLQKLF